MPTNRFPASWLTIAATAAAFAATTGTAVAAPTEPTPATPGAVVVSGTFVGTPGDDIIIGSAGVDYIDGAGGNDTIVGGGGNDTLVGGAGNNTLFGDAGDDVLTSGTGNDAFVGGIGRDRLTYSNRPGDVTVIVELNNLNDPGNPGGEPRFDGTDPDGQGFTTLNGEALTGENDKVYDDVEDARGGAGPDSLVGGTGQNVLTGLGGQDALYGLGGNDVLRGADGGDAIQGGDGDDQIEPGNEADAVRGGEGNDTIISNGAGQDGNDDVQGQGGVDTVLYSERTGPTRVTLAGTTFDDGAYNPSNLAQLVERDRLRTVENAVTGTGNDILTGDAQANALISGSGDDTLTGGAGQDTLSGRAGNDTLNALDGEVDTVKGGDGTDTGTKDATDLLTFDTEF